MSGTTCVFDTLPYIYEYCLDIPYPCFFCIVFKNIVKNWAICIFFTTLIFFFVCLECFFPLKNFHSFKDVTIAGEGLHILTGSALMAIEQWGFFSVPHLLWHGPSIVSRLLWYGPSIYNGYLRGPMSLTPVAERLAVELSLSVLTVCRGWDSNTQPSACEANALTHCAAAAVTFILLYCFV